MYKTLAALGVVLALVSSAAYQMVGLLPEPKANTVLAEKSSVILGGQAAVLVPDNLSTSQYQVLNTAYQIAKADGHKNPELVQGILLQESKAGAMNSYKVAGNKGDEYYGLGQIKLAATRDVMATFPALWAKYKFQTKTDDELKANLILNQTFNIEITSKYLKMLQERYGLSGRQLVNAYNRGPGGVKNVDSSFHYAIGVEKNIANMRKKKDS
jgi:hypothetical protein